MNWTLIVTLIALPIALFQAYQARKTFRADHERRKKQATLDAWDAVRTRCAPELALLWETYRSSPTLNEKDAQRLYAAEGERNAVRVALQQYLNSLERVAVGARLGIYDLDVLDEIARGAILGARDRFKAFVLLGRKEHDERLYAAQWWLADELDRRAKPEAPLPRGRIRTS